MNVDRDEQHLLRADTCSSAAMAPLLASARGPFPGSAEIWQPFPTREELRQGSQYQKKSIPFFSSSVFFTCSSANFYISHIEIIHPVNHIKYKQKRIEQMWVGMESNTRKGKNKLGEKDKNEYWKMESYNFDIMSPYHLLVHKWLPYRLLGCQKAVDCVNNRSLMQLHEYKISTSRNLAERWLCRLWFWWREQGWLCLLVEGEGSLKGWAG